MGSLAELSEKRRGTPGPGQSGDEGGGAGLLQSKLARHSVTAIEAKGQAFDPRVHHAISQASSTDATPGTVLHEVGKGYRVGKRLLRPATVVVASTPRIPQSEISRPDGEGTASGNTGSGGGGHRHHR